MRLLLSFVTLIVACKQATVYCEIDALNLDSSQNVIWRLANKNGSINTPGTVPGGVYSDLMKDGVISNILQGFNDVLTRWVAYDTWTYTAAFNVTSDQLDRKAARLYLHGVDTVADIEINGSPVLSTNNMFVRYTIDAKPHLKVGLNVLAVKFKSPVEAAAKRSEQHFTAPECVPAEYHGECHVNQLRKMQASFSWDWGPAFPSVGLWKSAEIIFFDNAIVRQITTKTKKKGDFWNLIIKTYLESSHKSAPISVRVEAKLQVEGSQTVEIARDFDVDTEGDGTAEIQLDMVISENLVRMWWPNGYGRQPLYDLHVQVTPQGDTAEVSSRHMRVGFRTVELVEVDASMKLGNSTAGRGLTFYFEVNGYPLFMKGSNWIPSHILPEHSYDKDRIDHLLLSAKEAHMSMLRVWGGGLYEDDYFYQRCDELGILVWQDFLFACNMYPVDPAYLQNVQIEIEQTVMRLQSHPSIALWAGNNENEAALIGNWYGTNPQFTKYKEEYIKLYVDTIRPIVENLDSNTYLVSSPTNGLKSEMDGYIAQNPYDPHFGDTHYYNYMADNSDFNIYPKTRFASEYGFQSMPSLHTIYQATRNAQDLKVDSDFSQHRQHSPGGYGYIENQINRHLKLERDDPEHFKKFIFYSQIVQAMAMKTETELYRQSQDDWYTMGALYWQLNDIWQAPSWAGIEYGGKWKMMHYYAKSFFAPVLVSPRLLSSGDVDVYLINDRFIPIIDAKIVVDVFNFSSLVPVSSQTYAANVAPLSSKKQDFEIQLWNLPTDEIFLRFSLEASGVRSSPYNFMFPKPLKEVKGLTDPNIRIQVSNKVIQVKDEYQYIVTVRVDRVVLFLWLEADAVQGRFDNNGFIVTKPYVRVLFKSRERIEATDFEKKIAYQFYVN